jgi:hypothetical protein
MTALAVVADFDEVEDHGPGLLVGFEPIAVDEFEIEVAPDNFHGGVIAAVAVTAHGGVGLRLREEYGDS